MLRSLLALIPVALITASAPSGLRFKGAASVGQRNCEEKDLRGTCSPPCNLQEVAKGFQLFQGDGSTQKWDHYHLALPTTALGANWPQEFQFKKKTPGYGPGHEYCFCSIKGLAESKADCRRALGPGGAANINRNCTPGQELLKAAIKHAQNLVHVAKCGKR